ncbi:MAG: hypothetical protein ABIP02_04985 [Arenimonas sp.]
MKKSIVAISLLAFSVTAAIAATNNSGLLKKISPARQKLQIAIKKEMRDYLRTDGMVELASPANTTKAYTDAQVGDANSFGRNVKFMGMVQTGVLTIAADCTPDPAFPPGPNDHCLVPDVNSNTSFNYPNLGAVLIPGKSSKSLFCHSQTPFGVMIYHNGTGVYQGTARSVFNVTYKIENEVLSDPSLIDPNTGLPFGGSLQTSLSAVRDSRGLQPGDTQVYRDNYTRMCNAGIVSKRSLIEGYGLTDAQATAFFNKDTVITIGLVGSTRLVSDGSMIVGTRFYGD